MNKQVDGDDDDRPAVVIDGGVRDGLHWVFEIEAVGGEEGRWLEEEQTRAILELLKSTQAKDHDGKGAE